MDTAMAEGKAKPRRPIATARDAKAVLRFTRQLAVKLKAGLSVEKCLAALVTETRHRRVQRACIAMRAAVAGGTPLWQAMRSHGSLFDPCVVGLVASAERGGRLRAGLANVADYLEERVNLEASLHGATASPLAALSMVLLATFAATVALSFLVKDVLPTASGQGHPALPIADHVAFHVASAVRAVWPVIGVLGFVGFVALRLLPRRAETREWIEAIALRLPLVGPALRATGYAILTKTVGLWMQAGNPLAQAMEMGLLTAHSWPMRQRIAATMQRIEGGRPYIEAFVDDGLLRLGDVTAVQAGERRGDLAQVMLTLAIDRRQEAEHDIKRLRAVTHTVVVVLLGLVILGVVLTLYVPVFVAR